MYNHIGELPPRSAEILATTRVERAGDCIIWRGALDRYGYGIVTVKFGGRRYAIGAHRLAYLTHVGPIRGVLVIDHLCHHRACINTSHLEVVTNRQNLSPERRSYRTRCRRGHKLSGDNLRTYQGRRICKECGRQAAQRYRAKSRQGAA